MLILLSWLKEYLPGLDAAGLPDILTRAGIEVDHIAPVIPQFSHVVAARIVKVCKHEHAPKLACATIFDGKKEHTVACSASNCSEGLITAYAPVGAMLGQKSVQAVQFGDFSSAGIICSEHELGLTDYHGGVMELPSTMKEGTLLESFFTDTIFDVSITPNLGHCQSVMGVARELSAFLGLTLAKRPWMEVAHHELKATAKLQIDVQDPVLCPRYSAMLLEGVQVGPSPSLIRIRLEQSGYRSINNVVDITNYVQHDIGQPLHAFDADRVHSGKLIVRASKEHESLTFLDDTHRQLPEGTIVIADGQHILAAAGIMGGESSAVTVNTNRVILESAAFNPSTIRKARTKLFISTESSKRFERGSDSDLTLVAQFLAYSMLKKGTHKLHLEGLVDVAQKRQEKKVSCRLHRAGALLGYEVSASEAESAFSSLYLPFDFDGQDTYTITVPSFRHDLNEEVDLIEEIGRIVGLQQGVEKAPRYANSTIPHHPLYLFEGEVRRRLLSFGLQEALTSDLISPEMAHLITDHTITDDALVKMLNPLSSEQSVLRPSLVTGLLEVTHRNLNQRILDLHFFEVGHVHLKKGEGYVEPRVFAILLTGRAMPFHFSEPPREVDFFDLKGMVEELFSTLRFSNITAQKSGFKMLHPGRQAKIYLDGVHVGIMGEIHPELLDKLDIHQRVLFAECDMQELMKLPRKVQKMEPLALFPSSERDWTVTVPKSEHFDAIMAKINEIKPSICEKSSLVAIFEHEKLGEDRHNITLNFVYRDSNKTVSQEEVEQAHERLVRGVTQYLAEKYPV